MGQIAVSYPRTSSEKGDASFSMRSQAEAIRDYAERHGLTIVYELPEEFTGKVMDRPQLNKIRALARQGNVGAMIVYTVDRLARKTSVADLLLDELTEKPRSRTTRRVLGQTCGARQTDHSQFLFEAVISDLERERIVERTTRGRTKKLHAGAFPGTGRPPYPLRQSRPALRDATNHQRTAS